MNKNISFEEYLRLNGITNKDYTFYIQKIKEAGVNLENEEEINRYLLEISSKVADNTFNLIISSLKKYYEYKGLNIKLPRRRKIRESLPEYIPYEDLENEIFPIVDCIFKNPLKVKTILLFLFVTGVRKSVIENLRRRDFDLEKRIVRVYEKKTKEEFIKPLTPKLVEFLKLYFETEPELKNAFNASVSLINKIFRKLKPYYKKANLHPHIFRASLAVHLLKKGMDLRRIQKILGHKNIDTTAKYLKLTQEDVINGFEKYFEEGGDEK